MTKDSILGPMSARKKTDLRLPAHLHSSMQDLADAIGVPLNAMFAMAAAQFVVQLGRVSPHGKVKQRETLEKLESLFQHVVAEARKVL